jgi:hypothetical protein
VQVPSPALSRQPPVSTTVGSAVSGTSTGIVQTRVGALAGSENVQFRRVSPAGRQSVWAGPVRVPKVVPVGARMLTVRPVASDGPALVAVTVRVAVPPGSTVPGAGGTVT